MSNGISSLGALASINANQAFGTKIDALKKGAKEKHDYIRHVIHEVLETREEKISDASTHSLVDAILKPIGAAVGFFFGGPGGAAAGWSGVDAATDLFFGSRKSISPETREGADLAAQYHMQAPGTNLGKDISGWLQEGFQMYSLATGVDKRLAKAGKSFGKAGAPKVVAPTAAKAGVVDDIPTVEADIIPKVLKPTVPSVEANVIPKTIKPTSEALSGQALKDAMDKMNILKLTDSDRAIIEAAKDTSLDSLTPSDRGIIKAAKGLKASEDISFSDIDKFLEEFQYYPGKQAVNGFTQYEVDVVRPTIYT